MDTIDQALVRELQADASITNRELARRVGVSPSTALERVRALHRRGVLTGYHAEVSLRALGREVQALVSVRIRPPTRDRIDAFLAYADGLPEILDAYLVTGHEDIILHAAVTETDALYGLVIDHLTARPEVIDVRTSIVYAHRRQYVVGPLPPRASTHETG
ncbi:MAG: Lrp/AsnC family transcriptional regulator [Nitriliruptor sp.]|nr:MAG: Lrp/AsnC family transcriptional regulator [Nitriliruptor sp.]